MNIILHFICVFVFVVQVQSTGEAVVQGLMGAAVTVSLFSFLMFILYL